MYYKVHQSSNTILCTADVDGHHHHNDILYKLYTTDEQYFRILLYTWKGKLEIFHEFAFYLQLTETLTTLQHSKRHKMSTSELKSTDFWVSEANN